MGWKNVKEHYRIGHIVRVTAQGICIGSGYVSDIMVVDLEGRLVKRYENGGNADLLRYQAEMDADPARLRELATTPDQFINAVPVYTYAGAEIFEKYCEKPGWPNVTHDGELMYENTFFPDREQAIQRAAREAAAAAKMLRQSIAKAEQQLEELRAELGAAEAAQGTLLAMQSNPAAALE